MLNNTIFFFRMEQHIVDYSTTGHIHVLVLPFIPVPRANQDQQLGSIALRF
jgi:hypothetical protein